LTERKKTYEELEEEIRRLTKTLAWQQRLIDAQTLAPRQKWEIEQDYLPYEESPYGDS
jgi:hypothetical protein